MKNQKTNWISFISFLGHVTAVVAAAAAADNIAVFVCVDCIKTPGFVIFGIQ